ncbi:transglutaminase-like cysteine peptidase, partial [Telmatospirillum sp.]|uniref:transglutaminase-like cysteine peptidase n=1 Tax=Telmatospirillum sp. TaxID=2079197 RepID=UPI002845A04E
ERITPDRAKGGFDWSIDTTYGNCNDYAVQKRKALLDKGYPASALSLSAVLTSWGEGHLVLTVRTDRGDYVLDNLRPTILSWDRTGYEFNRVQSLADPQTWVHPGKALRRVGPRFFRINASFEPRTTDSIPLPAAAPLPAKAPAPALTAAAIVAAAAYQFDMQ